MVLSKKDRKLKEGIASLDMTVSTLKNIKGFKSLPPDGLKLYVKYRGDISPGQGSEETPLGEEPKNIQGRILDTLNYPPDPKTDTDNHFFLIILKVTKSPDPNDIGKKISIYPTRDHISLYPFESLIGSMKKRFKRIFKRRESERRESDNYGGAKKKKSKKKFKKRNYKKLKKRKTKKKMKFRKKTKKKKRKSNRKK